LGFSFEPGGLSITAVCALCAQTQPCTPHAGEAGADRLLRTGLVVFLEPFADDAAPAGSGTPLTPPVGLVCFYFA